MKFKTYITSEDTKLLQIYSYYPFGLGKAIIPHQTIQMSLHDPNHKDPYELSPCQH